MTAQTQRGTRVNLFPIHVQVSGFSTAAVTAGPQVLARQAMPGPGRIRSVVCDATTAGSGAGSTIIDLKVNAVSVYTTTANRPTLATADTGSFANAAPDVMGVKFGDVVTLEVITIPASTGHAGVCATAYVELA